MLTCTYMIMFVLFMAFGYTMLLSATNLTERESRLFGNDVKHFCVSESFSLRPGIVFSKNEIL